MDLNCSNSTTISTLTVITQSKSALIAVLEMKIWIYWSESNSLIYLIFIYLIKLKKLLVWTKFYWSWAGGPVDTVRTYSSALFSGRGIYKCIPKNSHPPTGVLIIRGLAKDKLLTWINSGLNIYRFVSQINFICIKVRKNNELENVIY